MKNFKLLRFACVAFASAMVVSALAGCAASEPAVDEEQAANRQYMATVNQAMDDLADKLSSFDDAVARGDVVTMMTQAEKAFKEIDELAAAEAPEVLADVKAGYVEGCAALEEALSSYVDLFTQLENGSIDPDSAEFADALAAVQALYDEGIAALEETDKAALEL